ncbi:hypothetical protein GCM10027020_32400 [Nocardioides salsibiostraticola]
MHPSDVERWRAKLDQIEAAALADPEIQEIWADRDRNRPARKAAARAIVEEFIASRDFDAFRAATDAWAREGEPYMGFRGYGQMWLNQVGANMPDDPEVLDVLVRAFTTPESIEGAMRRFEDVARVTRDLSSKGQPAVGRIPFVLSLFWSMDVSADPAWPCLWTSAPERMSQLGWVSSWNNAERYPPFVEAARTFCPDDVDRFDRLMWVLTEHHRFVGVNPTLGEMCQEAAGLLVAATSGSGYRDEEERERARSLAEQIKGDLVLAAEGLHQELNEIVAMELEVPKSSTRISFDSDAPYRADGYAAWTLPGGMSAPGFRLWATKSGLAIGVYGGWDSAATGKAVTQAAEVTAAKMAEALPVACNFFDVRPHKSGDRLQSTASFSGGEVFAGRLWNWADVPEGLTLRTAITEHAAELLPVLRAVIDERSAASDVPPELSNEIVEQLARYKVERPYPNDKDPWQEAQRQEFAQDLAAEALSELELGRMRLMIASRYGGTGNQSGLNKTLSAMDAVEFETFAEKLREILWGEGDLVERIDRGLDSNDLGVKGLGETMLLKLFAITQPERFLATFPLNGNSGKLAMLRRLGLEEPDSALSVGQRHVAANDALRAALEPLLPNDPWGQTQFAYWLLENSHEDESVDDEDRIATAAADLLVSETFLHEIDALLREKGQLIFYGPPGTGKTFIADRFAEALQPDPTRRMVVQFHPSMSYEDFFEGYRPDLGDGGQLTYTLRKGPLALMAEMAEKSSGLPHVLIIDEINRANLPRVFGELLYLLEYRNKAVRTAYRPDEPFQLPKNLYIIGTMNTADRSIAMVDAALRRRFHFIPFMPHEGEMASLLSDWLIKHHEPAWVAGLVDQVNSRLRHLLKGPHLQVGHSHFMVRKEAGATTILTDQRLQRIWDYDIYPFIEDQLYGRPNDLAQFGWAKVYADFGPASASGVDAQAEQELAETSVDESAH